MAITHVRHVDIFLAIYRDFQRIGQRFVHGKKADLFATTLRILEMRRNEQIKRLINSGEEESTITEDQLGFPMTWQFFNQLSLGHYGKRSFEMISKEVVKAGFASQCYVECHRRKDEAGQEELVLVSDYQSGKPLLYATIDEARAHRREDGDIVNYFFFHVKAVNDLVAQIYGLARPSGPLPPPNPPDDDDPNKKKGGTQREQQSGDANAEQPPPSSSPTATKQREGNPRVKSELAHSRGNIPHPSQNCEGVDSPKIRKYHNSVSSGQNCKGVEGSQNTNPSQNCEGGPGKTAGGGSQNCETPPRKTASNKNLIKEGLESTEELLSNSASSAIALALSQYDFSQPITAEAVDGLARLLYPSLKEPAFDRVTASAHKLAESGIVAQIGLRALAADMLYQVDEASPCRWRPWCRDTYKKPKLAMRPWHLESETVLWKMHQEREAANWWPDVLPRAGGLVEVPPEIDLAELAGIHRDDRVGIAWPECGFVENWLAELLKPHGYEVAQRRVGATDDRGWAIEVRYPHEDGTRRTIRFYREEDWDLIIQAEEAAFQAGELHPLGSLEFIRHLSEAVQHSQVA